MAPKRTVTKVCLICGGRVRVNAAKYCGMSCYRASEELRKTKFIESWLAGDLSKASRKDGELVVVIRQWLKKEADYKCQRCGWGTPHPIDGIVPVEVEHIDGNSRNQLRENLIVLCPNCHSLTPTYGARNIGNGRQNRRKTGL